jgi:hypothetical protein
MSEVSTGCSHVDVVDVAVLGAVGKAVVIAWLKLNSGEEINVSPLVLFELSKFLFSGLNLHGGLAVNWESLRLHMEVVVAVRTGENNVRLIGKL